MIKKNPIESFTKLMSQSLLNFNLWRWISYFQRSQLAISARHLFDQVYKVHRVRAVKKAFDFKSATTLKLPASPSSVLVTTSCTSWWTMPPPHEGDAQDVEDEMNWGDPPPQVGDGRGCDGEAGGARGGSVAGPGRSGRKVVNRLFSCLSAMAVKFAW